MVIIDRDLVVLEWMKNALAPLGLRAHIFPRSELAIQRIRQYFARGETPLVVLTSETPPDPVSGARDWAEIAARLRAQVPQLPLLVVSSAGAAVSPANERAIPDAVATRPPLSVLARRARSREARGLRRGTAQCGVARAGAGRDRRARRSALSRETHDPLRALREWSARLRDPAPPSEVLRTVLEFAGRHFDRVAIFWLRDGEAQAMAQLGLPATGGPDGRSAARDLCCGRRARILSQGAREPRAAATRSGARPATSPSRRGSVPRRRRISTSRRSNRAGRWRRCSTPTTR